MFSNLICLVLMDSDTGSENVSLINHVLYQVARKHEVKRVYHDMYKIDSYSYS